MSAFGTIEALEVDTCGGWVAIVEWDADALDPDGKRPPASYWPTGENVERKARSSMKKGDRCEAVFESVTQTPGRSYYRSSVRPAAPRTEQQEKVRKLESRWLEWNALGDEIDHLDTQIGDLQDQMVVLKAARRDADRRRSEAGSDAGLYIAYIEATTGASPRREENG